MAPTPAAAPVSAEVPVLSSALQIQFPDPPVRYVTPGLQQGRTAWSNAEEIAAWLRELAAPPPAPASAASPSRRGTPVKVNLLNLGPPPSGLAGLADPAPKLETSLVTGPGLQALHLSAVRRPPNPAPAATEPIPRPTVLLLGGRQASAATEALLLVARELARGTLRPLLARINVVVVPHTGLAELTDPTAPDDHVQLNTASAQILAGLARTQQATVVISTGEAPALTTLGTQTLLRAADVTVAHANSQNLPEFLTRAAGQWFQQPMLAALKNHALRADKAPWAGLAMAGEAQNAENIAIAAALKNRIGLQVITAGSDLGRAHVQRRVHAQVTALSSALASTARRAAELAELRPYLDRDVAAQACRQPFEIAVQPAEQTMHWLDLSTGAEISFLPSPAMPTNVSSEPIRIKPCGYWLAADASQAVERLRLHGVRVLRVNEPTALLGDGYKPVKKDKSTDARIQSPAQAAGLGPVEGSAYSLVRGLIDAPLGSYYVPVDQPLGNLVVAALEPDGPSSLAALGWIDVAAGLARIMTPPTVPFEAIP